MSKAPREATNAPIALDNETCPYCGVVLTEPNKTREHVVGRRFVPKGTLNGAWNLILDACQTCNNRKSILENDVSAITMQPSADGVFPVSHNSLMADASRKAARSVSSRTRRPVADSVETFKLGGQFAPGVAFTCTLVAPPQLEEDRVFALAHLQVGAFFYMLTYESVTPRRGGWWAGGFFPLVMSLRTDWGNEIHRYFMERTQLWSPRALGFTAEKFFKVAIRRHPGRKLWSWALEWNANLRVIGLVGDPVAAEEEIIALPKLKTNVVARSERALFRGRVEVPLKDDDDTLFADFGGDWGHPTTA